MNYYNERRVMTAIKGCCKATVPLQEQIRYKKKVYSKGHTVTHAPVGRIAAELLNNV